MSRILPSHLQVKLGGSYPQCQLEPKSCALTGADRKHLLYMKMAADKKEKTQLHKVALKGTVILAYQILVLNGARIIKACGRVCGYC